MLLLSCFFASILVNFAKGTPQEARHMTERMNAEPQISFPALVDLYLKQSFHISKNGSVSCKCKDLFRSLLDHDESEVAWPPPEQIPPELNNAFTLFGTIPVGKWYFAQPMESTQTVLVWDRDLFDEFLNKKSECGGYKSPVCEEALEQYSNIIKGKKGLVVGSQTPWAEAALLNHGAAELVTVEYLTIDSAHPLVYTMHPRVLAEGYLSETLDSIDFVFSFSSIEHDGLGRYGDPINPFGDLETMARIYCLLPPGGYFFLGVPTGPFDVLFWNAHRVYGRHRMRLLLQDLWEVVDFFHVTSFEVLKFKDKMPTGSSEVGYEEALWILRKKDLAVVDPEDGYDEMEVSAED